MTISEALKKYKDIEADLLLGHVLKKSKEFLYLNSEKKLTETQRKKFILAANYRRHGVPIAYIVGYKYFYGLKFKVSRDVLIPRPETEWLVEKSLRIISAKLKRPHIKKLRVLDLGTGSGCIAISIAKNIKSKYVEIDAIDQSFEALRLAKANAKTLKAKIHFIQSDLLANTEAKYDLIIANLPYVPISDYKKLYSNLKFEPKRALTDGHDDFRLIKKFLKQAPTHLQPGGTIILEVDPKFFRQKQDHPWRIVKDLHNLNRFALLKGAIK